MKGWITIHETDRIRFTLSKPERIQSSMPTGVLKTSQLHALGKALAEAGVHRVEAGVPAESEEDRAVAKEPASLGLGSQIFAFSPTNERAAEKAKKCGLSGLIMKMVTGDHQAAASGARSTLIHGFPHRVLQPPAWPLSLGAWQKP